MDHKNPFIRLGVYGRLKRMVGTFKNLDLDQIDQTEKRLIRGIFFKRLLDFDEQHSQKQSQIPLIERLAGNSLDLIQVEQMNENEEPIALRKLLENKNTKVKQ